MLISLPDGHIDLDRREIRRDGFLGTLTPTEAKLVQYLAGRSGKVVPPMELLREVWGYVSDVSLPAIKVTAHRLRKKIELDPQQPKVLLTKSGMGLCWEIPAAPPNAPPAIPRLWGRESDQKRLVDLAGSFFVVSIVGPGGIGKTALLRWWEATVALPGVWVSLEHAKTVADVEAGIRQAAGLEPDAPWEPWLRSGAVARVLLDHADGVEALSAWVQECRSRTPGVQWVISVRRPLGILEEAVVNLDPLPAVAVREWLGFLVAQKGLELPTAEGLDKAVAFAAGWPLALETLVHSARYADGDSWWTAIRERAGSPLERLLAELWSQAGEDERRAAQQLSILRRPFSLVVAREVLEDLSEEWPALVDHHWVTRQGKAWGFHPMVLDFLTKTEGFAAEAEAAASAVWSVWTARASAFGMTEAADDTCLGLLDLAGQFPQRTEWVADLLLPEIQFQIWHRNQIHRWVSVLQAMSLTVAQRQYVWARGAAYPGTIAHSRGWLESAAAIPEPMEPLTLTLAGFAAVRREHEEGDRLAAASTWERQLSEIRTSGVWESPIVHMNDLLIRFAAVDNGLDAAGAVALLEEVKAFELGNPVQRIELRWALAELTGDVGEIFRAWRDKSAAGQSQKALERVSYSCVFVNSLDLLREAEQKVLALVDVSERAERSMVLALVFARVWFQTEDAEQSLVALTPEGATLGRDPSEWCRWVHRVRTQAVERSSFRRWLDRLEGWPGRQVYRVLGHLVLAELETDRELALGDLARVAEVASGLPATHPLHRLAAQRRMRWA